MPYWAQIGENDQDGIIYRGSFLQLKSEFLSITISNIGFTSKSVIGTKRESLSNCLDGQLETQMVIHKDKQDNNEEQFQYTNIKGTVKIALMPKFVQTGEL